MSKMIRMLGVFDYNTSTGFGTVAKNIVGELRKHFRENLQLDIIALNYFGEPYHEDDNTYVVSGKLNDPTQDDFGRHFYLNILKNSNEYDILFLINDLGAVVPIIEILDSIKKEKKESNQKVFKSIYYFPLDCTGFYQILKGLEFFDTLVTFTEFARKEIINARPELKSKLKVINHGTNTSDFRPIQDNVDFKLWRNEFLGENADKFIITNLNRNQPRKDIPATIFAFREAKKMWDKNLPEPFLYLHMRAKDPLGYDLKAIFWQLDLVEGKDYKLLPDEWEVNLPSVEEVNMVYNASNLYLTTTLAEGWGLGITEAMATMTPIICPKNTSLSEMTNFGERAFVYETDYPVVNTTDNIIRYQGSIYDVADKILEVANLYYNDTQELTKKKHAAYNWASKLTWKELSKRWIEYIKELS